MSCTVAGGQLKSPGVLTGKELHSREQFGLPSETKETEAMGTQGDEINLLQKHQHFLPSQQLPCKRRDHSLEKANPSGTQGETGTVTHLALQPSCQHQCRFPLHLCCVDAAGSAGKAPVCSCHQCVLSSIHRGNLTWC